jgi:predicted phosphoadenosine phosphosulfate sulfurtransferase
MADTHLAINVYEAALDRVRFVFDNCDDIVVAMSGGKDSTVLLHLARTVAAERGRLPLKVFWFDQEAEWQATGNYMRSVMYAPDIVPWWFQVPFRLTNSLSASDNYLHCWDPAARDIWIREQDPVSVKANPLPQFDRFHDLAQNLTLCCDTADKQHVGKLVGLRTAESPARRLLITRVRRREAFRGITWSRKPVGNTRTFWPIYDFQDRDVWACIAQNNLPYNRIYDAMYRFGITGRNMRVSALIHETAWHHLKELQEIEPQTYSRFVRRLHGANCFTQLHDDIMPRKLPPAFVDWREYRDYLLKHLIEPRYHDLFRRRWRQQQGEDWYKVHVREIMINDTDGTLNHNEGVKLKSVENRTSGARFDLGQRRLEEAIARGDGSVID